MNYYQCFLQKNIPEGVQSTTTWIPEEFAVRGMILQLKNKGVWDNGWIVKSIGTCLDENHLPDPHKDIKAHRKNTKDSDRKQTD